MRLTIEHRTRYVFSQPQRRLVQLLRLVPPSFPGQSVIDWHVAVDRDARLKSGRDGYGNETVMLYVDGPIDALTVSVSGEVLTEDTAGVVQGAPEPLPPLLFTRTTAQTAPDAGIAAFAHAIAGDPRRDAAATFAEKRGVCQDHAHLFIAAARTLGHPARYVSGHLFRTDGAGTQPAAHAWAEAHVDGLGWVGFDAANGYCPTDAYVRIACGLDYHDAAPVSGARVGAGRERLEVAVSVAELASQRQSQG